MCLTSDIKCFEYNTCLAFCPLPKVIYRKYILQTLKWIFYFCWLLANRNFSKPTFEGGFFHDSIGKTNTKPLNKTKVSLHHRVNTKELINMKIRKLSILAVNWTYWVKIGNSVSVPVFVVLGIYKFPTAFNARTI